MTADVPLFLGTVEEMVEHLRSQGFRILAPDDDADFRVSKGHPDTSRAIAPKMRQGTLQAEVLGYVEGAGRAGCVGITVDEVERRTARSHQSISATMNTLMRKGLVRDSGQRSRTRYGNEAILWTRTDREATS